MVKITAAVLKKNRNTIGAARKAYTRAEKEHATLVRVDDDTGLKMQAADLEKTEEAWGDFLLYSDMVFQKLKYGKRSIDEKWFSEVEATYGSDELLVYLHLARNDLTHGLLDGTSQQKFEQKLEHYAVLEKKIVDGQDTVVATPLGSELKQSLRSRRGTCRTHTPFECGTDHLSWLRPLADPWTMITPGLVILRPLQLTDRRAPNGGRTAPLPRSHLGEAVAVGTPRGAADLAIKFYGDMLAKAKAFVEQQAAQP